MRKEKIRTQMERVRGEDSRVKAPLRAQGSHSWGQGDAVVVAVVLGERRPKGGEAGKQTVREGWPIREAKICVLFFWDGKFPHLYFFLGYCCLSL